MAAPKNNQHSARYLHRGVLWHACMYAKQGVSKTDCFRLAGVHPDTGFMWLKRGRDAEPGCPEILIRFEQVFERCIAQHRKHLVNVVKDAAMSRAPNTWQAAMTMLERGDPGNWGRRDVTTIQGGNGKGPALQVNQVVLIDGDARDAARALLRRVASHSADEPIGIGMGGESEEESSAVHEPIDVDPRPAR